jgi:integrase
MAFATTDNLKYVTSFRDRHGKRRFYFRYRHQKFKLPGKPGEAAFHDSSWGKPFSSSQSLCEKIKIMLRRIGESSYVPHGLRATAAVRLIEAGCSEDLAAAVTGHRDLNVLRGICTRCRPEEIGPPCHAEAGGKLIGHSGDSSAKVPNP